MKKLSLDKKLLKRLKPSENYFLSLCGSIIYQQISTAAGNSIYKRFLVLFGKRKPTPKLLLTISDGDLRNAGLSRGKVVYLKDLAEKFINKTIDPTHFDTMSDVEIKDHLVQVKGIGPWTADMFLIFSLNRPNILPVGDLAIRKGFQKVFGLRKVPNEKQMRKIAREYEGFHTHLSLHLWQSLDQQTESEMLDK